VQTTLKIDAEMRSRYKAQAEIIKALADPTRLMIVDQLSQGERCVCELTEMAGLDMSTVSRHLRQLKSAGLLVDDKRGTQVFYKLKIPCILNFFKCVESVQKAS
jgi:DNA-binding transcriptional ArsR family regulator